jgi:hypothetical protein
MSATMRVSATMSILAGLLLAGCAGDGTDSFFTTGALGTASATPDPKSDPQCVSLASRIEALRKEGIGDKIEKAATKKYKMTQSDLAKADQLTKANADFQIRCSTVVPDPTLANPAPPQPTSPAPKAKATPKAASASTN